MSSDIFSHRLLSFRESRGLTQTDMAALLGVSSRYVSQLENGTRDVDPNSSLFRLFVAYESGQVPVRMNGVREDVARTYPVATPPRSDSVGTGAGVNGLSSNDVLSQVRADLAMIEGGAQSEKRRAYHFLRDVHLPMLAKMLKLD